MNRIFIDMDGVLADYDGLRAQLGVTSQEFKALPGAYARLAPLPGALAGARRLIALGYDVWIATKPPHSVPQACADKVSWILQHLPELKRKIIMTPDKGLLGDAQDFLIDDRPDKANCREFRGELIPFTEGLTWADITERFDAKGKV